MFAFYFLFSLASFILRPGPLNQMNEDEGDGGAVVSGSGAGQGTPNSGSVSVPSTGAVHNGDGRPKNDNHRNSMDAVDTNNANSNDDVVTVVIYANSTITGQLLQQQHQHLQQQQQDQQQPLRTTTSIHNFIELFSNIDNTSSKFYTTANKQSYRKLKDDEDLKETLSILLRRGISKEQFLALVLSKYEEY